MKSRVKTSLALGAIATLLMGCEVTNMQTLFSDIIPTHVLNDSESNHAVVWAPLEFIQNRLYMSERRVCDQVACGTHTVTRCETRSTCDYPAAFDLNTLGPHDEVIASTSTTLTIDKLLFETSELKRGGPRRGASGGSVSRPPRYSGGGGSGGGGSRGGGGGGSGDDYDDEPDCDTYEDCEDVEETKYCDTNCRMEPYRATERTIVPTPLHIVLVGVDTDEVSQITELKIVARPKERFYRILKFPHRERAEIRHMAQQLNAQAKTVVYLKAKGFRLAGEQNAFLEVPADWRPGLPLVTRLTLVKTGDDDEERSVYGTAKTLPARDFTFDDTARGIDGGTDGNSGSNDSNPQDGPPAPQP